MPWRASNQSKICSFFGADKRHDFNIKYAHQKWRCSNVSQIYKICLMLFIFLGRNDFKEFGVKLSKFHHNKLITLQQSFLFVGSRNMNNLLVVKIKEVQIVNRLFPVNCYLSTACTYLSFLPSQLATREAEWLIELAWTGLTVHSDD